MEDGKAGIKSNLVFLIICSRLVRLNGLAIDQFLQSLFDLSVPEAINERVESRGHDGIEDGNNFVHVEGMDGSRPGIHKNSG